MKNSTKAKVRQTRLYNQLDLLDTQRGKLIKLTRTLELKLNRAQRKLDEVDFRAEEIENDINDIIGSRDIVRNMK